VTRAILRCVPGDIEDGDLPHRQPALCWVDVASGRQWERPVKPDGLSQSNVDGTKLSLMPLPVPPPSERSVFVERSPSGLPLAARGLDRATSAERTTALAWKAVLSKAFTGDLVAQGAQ